MSDQQSGGCLLAGGGTQAPFWLFYRAHWGIGEVLRNTKGCKTPCLVGGGWGQEGFRGKVFSSEGVLLQGRSGLMLFGGEAVWKQGDLGVRETGTNALGARMFGSKGFWRQGPLKVKFEAEGAWGQKHLGVKAFAG